jgi:hypothetical protein
MRSLEKQGNKVQIVIVGNALARLFVPPTHALKNGNSSRQSLGSSLEIYDLPLFLPLS